MPVRDLLSAASGASAPADPYFYDVSLLLNGDGTNGSQNNTFLDSSTNNFTITRNGNTTQGSFSPYGSNWSNYFNGSSDLTAPANSAFAFSADFTIEGWAYPTAPGGFQHYFDFRSFGSSADGFTIGLTGSTPYPWIYSGSGTVLTGSIPVPVNQWSHFAVVRSGSTITFYVNGVSAGTWNSSTNFTDNNCVIGRYMGSASEFYAGYLSNLRIVKGTALYTTSFTPPTTPLTAISGTSLLTCQSNRFIDNSSNAFAITVNGTISVQRFSPFNPTAPYSTSVIGGSGYFDGSGDYLSAPSNAAFGIGTGDYTFECWVFKQTSSRVALFAIASAGLSVSINTSGNIEVNRSLTAIDFTFTAGVPNNTWTHLAVVRSGTSLQAFMNGASLGTQTSSTSYGQGICYVGIDADASSTPYTGYISNFRLVKGSAVYTAAFAPPTAPLTAITNTALLLSTTNAGIPDLAMQNNLETVGDAQVSTSVKKYGTGSLAFDGTGDFIQGGAFTSPVYAFGTGNFTVEAWLYTNTNKTQIVIDTGTTSGSTTGLQVALNSSGYPYFVISNSVVLTSSIIVNTTTWTHVAWVRNSGTITVYVNGVSGGSTSNTTNISDTGLTIGTPNDWRNTSSSFHFDGYIDDLRITKGLARYTANFTPPTAALPTY